LLLHSSNLSSIGIQEWKTGKQIDIDQITLTPLYCIFIKIGETPFMSANTRMDPGQAKLDQRYNPMARLFHWVVVTLLVVQVTIALVLPSILPKADEDRLTAWHLSVGSTILLVMLLRLAWRLTHPVPSPPVDLPPALRLLSRATHWAFYVILVVLPLLGWTAASAFGATVRLFGLIPLPALTAPNKPFAEAIGSVHAAVAFVLLALIALHVAGALYHVLIKRDGVIRRMLPG